jgi:hypothetical protein
MGEREARPELVIRKRPSTDHCRRIAGVLQPGNFQEVDPAAEASSFVVQARPAGVINGAGSSIPMSDHVPELM